MTGDEYLKIEESKVDQRVKSSDPDGRRLRAWQEWMMVGVGLTGLMAVLSVIVAAVALSSTNTPTTVAATPASASMSASMSSSSGATSQSASTSAAAKTEAVKLTIKTDTEKGKLGPDGKWHDAFLPANFTVHAGDRVQVTVYNYDDAAHSFTSSTLSSSELINERIAGGSEKTPSKTTFTFTAPAPGKYLWWCTMPCDPYAMSHIGYMRGYVTVVA